MLHDQIGLTKICVSLGIGYKGRMSQENVSSLTENNLNILPAHNQGQQTADHIRI
jgi:hypothetical protein